ncbi:MAG: chemotaxis response regulator protein-glutamate methylesterase [SAR324 cluster bacterium]|uniref:Protein-glutamate methylesterase/protein-glutamine glutaminase n=1 Tax=SAR324 cluster bacterium TaxID=2024889 RepID=A0A2A4TAE3_9DELT|nr:MAG: chemotaxis response regulator protein-glutamate methylesterase [SAR324 cluster bacterium]
MEGMNLKSWNESAKAPNGGKRMEYKVLVVDDSALMRSELTKIIEKDEELKVVATARNGSQVLDKIRRFHPDVVTMDINMPIMDGIEALKQVMENAPLPVVMISSLTQEGAEETMDALNLGAFDFIAKPSGSISLDIATQGKIIRLKLKTAATSRSRWSLRKRITARPPAIRKPIVSQRSVRRSPIIRSGLRGAVPKKGIVAIGVSTGGPKTLMSILPQIPADFSGSILIAQHMPENFTLSFANRLNKVCSLHVKEAENGDIVEPGTIYVAPGGKHMKVKNRNNRLLMLEIVDDIPSKIYKPSVEVLFESLLENIGTNWLGVMLTGMGSDGARALTQLRKMGGHTIAESEESCVVFGMPGKVVEMGGAEYVLSEHEIASKIVEISGGLA